MFVFMPLGIFPGERKKEKEKAVQNRLPERTFPQKHARLTTTLSRLFLFHSRYHTRLTRYSIFQLLT